MEITAITTVVPEALPGRVILKYPPKNDRTAGGILLVRDTQARNSATVVSIGDGTDRAEEMFCKIVKVGDTVIADEIVGEPFIVREGEQDTEYRIFRTFEIIGYLPRG